MIKIALKDLTLFVKDKRALLLTFLLPMALATLFVFAYGGVSSSKTEEYILPVSDLDQTTASKNAIAVLDTHKNLEVKMVALDTAQENIRKGKAAAVLVLYSGFSDSLNEGRSLPVEIFYDKAEEVQVQMLQQALITTFSMLPFSKGEYVQQTMKRRNKEVAKTNEPLENKLNKEFDTFYNSLSTGLSSSQSFTGLNMFQTIRMTPLIKASNSNTLALVQAIVGTAILMLLFSVSGMGAGLLDEKQEGTLKKLLFSPISSNSILLGKMIAANVVAICQLSIMFLYAGLVFGLDVFSHLPALFLMIISTAFSCSGFGVFLASIARSRQQVQGYSMLVILVMSAIGGSMMPLFFMPAFMQKIAVISINYWGIQGFFDIFWRKLPIEDPIFLGRVLVLVVIGVVLNIIALRLFRKNLAQIM